MNLKAPGTLSVLSAGFIWFLFFLPLNEVAMLLGLVVAWGSYGFALSKNTLKLPKLNLSSYLFIVLGITSLIVAAFSPIQQKSLFFALHLFLSAFLGFVFFQGQEFCKDNLEKFLLAFLLGVFCLTCYELTRHLVEKGMNFNDSRLGYNAYLSLFLSVGLPIQLSRLLVENRKNKLFDTLLFVFFLVCFVLTFGRGAWLGAIAGMTYVAVTHSKKTTLVFFACLILGTIMIFPFIRGKARDIFRPETRSNAQRIMGWKTAVKMVKIYPLRGVGFTNFKSSYWSDEFRPLGAKVKLAHAHNIFLQVYAEQGVIVGTLLLALVIYFFASGFRLSSRLSGFEKIRVNGVNGALLSLIVGGQFACSMLINLRIWLLFCFLGAVLTSRNHKTT